MDLNAKVEALMRHTGVGDKLEADAIAARKAAAAEVRAKKRAAEEKFKTERDRLQALMAVADKKQVDSQKVAEAAMQDWIKLREQFSTIHETLTASNAIHDAALRQHVDPLIPAFIAELRELRDDCPRMYRMYEEAPGKVVDNRVAIDRRIRVLSDLIEAANRLITDPLVEDVPAEIARMRSSIPKA